MKKVTVEGVEFEVPDEANWIAVDESESAYWYVEEPEKALWFKCWDLFRFGTGHGYLGKVPVADWGKTLKKI